MSRDSSYTHLHLHSPHHADLFESFTSSLTSTSTASTFTPFQNPHPAFPPLVNPSSTTNPQSQGSNLPPDPILLPPHLEPLNPEDEDDVVPDQHAAFGIQKATKTGKEPVWRDLGIEELMRRKPKEGEKIGENLRGTGAMGLGMGMGRMDGGEGGRGEGR